MIKPIAQLSAMAPYELASLDHSLQSLSQNESLLPPSPAALEAGQQALSSSALYPDPDWTELCRAIASVHPIERRQILCGAGSMELIAACIQSYAGNDDEVLGSQFGYLFVDSVCRVIGAKYIKASETNYTVCIDSILAKVSERTRIVFVCNPGNPSGTRIPNSELVRLRNQLPANVLLIIDQAYAEFDDQNHDSIFALLDRENTVVLRTFSKAYCMAGQRLGWGAFPIGIAAEIKKILNPNNVSIVTQAMGAAAMCDQAYLQHVVSSTSAIRSRLQSTLTAASMPTPESHTNFVLVPFSDSNEAGQADTALKAAGFVVRGMGGYGLGHCLRITMASSDVMDEVAECLIQFKLIQSKPDQ